jgi:DNA-binding NarL/FixJ family response regulator
VIRVVIADDNAIVRAGLTQLLTSSDEIELVGVASNGAEAIELVGEHSPDVVLIDLVMPEVDGVEATRRLVAQRAELPVVVLTSFSDRERILAALDAGAVGYLLKDGDPEELIRGLLAAARGETPLHPRAVGALLSARRNSADARHLSAREQEVLDLVADGLSNKRIAMRLEISEKTVKAHLTRVYAQLGVSDRTEAALWAASHRE